MAETKEVLIEVKLDLKDAKTENSYLKVCVLFLF